MNRMNNLCHILFVCFMLCFTTELKAEIEMSLPFFIKRAEVLEELPKPDNKNTLNYEYVNQYVSIMSDIREIFQIESSDPVVREFPKKLAKSLAESQSNDLIVIRAQKDDRFIVFGDLHGAFHSLVRNLTYLRDQHILGDDLRLVDQKSYLIFNGNLIDRSPYNIETLSLVLTLLQQNPERVFYIKGRHETNDYWLSYNLKSELRTRFLKHDLKEIPLHEELSHFFATLPTGIFISSQADLKRFAYISPQRWSGKIDRLYFEKEAKESGISYLSSDPLFSEKNSRYVDMLNYQLTSRVDVSSQDYVRPDGLDLVLPDFGVTVWSVFSSPTQTYQDIFQFNVDSFAELVIGDDLNDSQLWHVTHDSTDSDLSKFSKVLYNPVTGMLEDKITASKQKIKVTSLLDMSDNFDLQGKRVAQGMNMRFREFQDKNEIPGSFIQHFIFNHENDPDLTQEYTDLATKLYDSHLFLMPFGQETLSDIKERQKDSDLAILFPDVIEYASLRDLTGPVVYYGASFFDEFRALVHFAKKSHKARFAIFYSHQMSNPAFESNVKNYIGSQADLNVNDFCFIPIDWVSDVKEAVEKFRTCDADVLLMFSSYYEAKRFVSAIGIEVLQNVMLMSNYILTDKLKIYLSGNQALYEENQGLNFVMSRLVPDPYDSRIGIIRSYQNAMNKYHPGVLYDADSLRAYIVASLFIDALKENPDALSPQDILKRIEGLKRSKDYGLTLEFSDKLKSFTHDVWLDDGSDKGFVRVLE